MPDGRELVVVSDRGGIANLELVQVETGDTRSLTRVTGAVIGPDVSRADSSIWFLSMRSGGYDLRHLAAPDERRVGDVVAIQGSLAPVAPPTLVSPGLAVTTDTSRVAVKDYGFGPRRWRVLPGGVVGPDGITGLLMAGNIDPIGRLSVVGQGAFGTAGTWRGASASAALRSLRVDLDASAWHVENEPSRSRDHLAPVSSDVRSTGIGVMTGFSGEGSTTEYLVRAGVGAGTVSNMLLDNAVRLSASADARGRISWSYGTWTVSAVGRFFGEVGSTDGQSWRRGIASATFSAGNARRYARGDWTLGSVTSPNGSSGLALEQFVVGGSANPLLDQAFLAQRIALPAVPPGLVGGNRMQVFRAALGLSGLEPYFIWASGGVSLADFKRVAGLEQTLTVSSLGFARLPGVRARAGASWSFDAPFEDRPRLYASLTYTP
jgi:hypothetical protein